MKFQKDLTDRPCRGLVKELRMRIGEIISFFAVGDLLSALEVCDDKNNSISFFNIRALLMVFFLSETV